MVEGIMERIWWAGDIDQSNIVQIILMLVLTNTMLDVEHHYDFWKIMDGLIL